VSAAEIIRFSLRHSARSLPARERCGSLLIRDKETHANHSMTSAAGLDPGPRGTVDFGSDFQDIPANTTPAARRFNQPGARRNIGMPPIADELAAVSGTLSGAARCPRISID
jgi:hypothetical protein